VLFASFPADLPLNAVTSNLPSCSQPDGSVKKIPPSCLRRHRDIAWPLPKAAAGFVMMCRGACAMRASSCVAAGACQGLAWQQPTCR
jgi:hypothetical protein